MRLFRVSSGSPLSRWIDQWGVIGDGLVADHADRPSSGDEAQSHNAWAGSWIPLRIISSRASVGFQPRTLRALEQS